MTTFVTQVLAFLGQPSLTQGLLRHRLVLAMTVAWGQLLCQPVPDSLNDASGDMTATLVCCCCKQLVVVHAEMRQGIM